MTTTACTVGPFAVGRGRCGKPAVVTFTARGITYAECAEHAPPFALRVPEPALTVGARVRVLHGGIEKAGTVVAVGRTIARVEVPVVRTGGVKVLPFPIETVKVAR